MKKILILCCIMSFIALIGCGQDKKESNKETTDTTTEESTLYTDSFLVSDSSTDYVILLPTKSTEEEKIAASELSVFFFEATGIKIETLSENDYTDGKYISIGKTNKLKENGIVVNTRTLTSSGYVIKTVNDNVFISGGTFGVVYGVYGFLEAQFNYRYYDDNLYTLNKGVKELKLIDFDNQVIPSIEYREISYGFQNQWITNVKDSMYRWRMHHNDLPYLGVNGTSEWHNFFLAIPKEVYQSQHPDWYSPDGTQLCLTRDLDGLAKEMAKKVELVLNENPTLEYVHIGMQDTRTWCECDKCKDTIAKYGGFNSSTYILFMKEVAKNLEAWEEKNPTRNVYLMMFAYHKTQDAPVVYNPTTGEYDVVSSDLILPDNVYVLYAPIEADYFKTFNDSENSSVKISIEGWSKMSRKLLLWIYMENFTDYQLPYWIFNSIQTNMQMLTENNTFWCFNQSQWNNGNSSGFSRLKAYVSSRLQWDCNLNVDDLIKEYCDVSFGQASGSMQRLISELGAWRAHSFYELAYNGELRTNPNGETYPFELLCGWMDIIDEAYEAIKPLKTTNKNEYERIYEAIKLESMSIRYMLITYHMNYFSKSELLQMKIDWKNDATDLRITKYWEHEDISALYKMWEIN